MAASIKPRDDGPYLVSGEFTLVDVDGGEWPIEEGQKIALCRCGHSEDKPFCDGSHKKFGFKSEVRAP